MEPARRPERGVGPALLFSAPEPRLFARPQRFRVSQWRIPARQYGVRRRPHTRERKAGAGLRAGRRVSRQAAFRLPRKRPYMGQHPRLQLAAGPARIDRYLVATRAGDADRPAGLRRAGFAALRRQSVLRVLAQDFLDGSDHGIYPPYWM